MQIVLLRGLGREAAHWGDFPKLLSQHLNELGHYTVDCIDLPACGSFHHLAACQSISQMTDHVRQHWLSNEHKKTLVIGLSMGGMLALDWAQRYPHELTGLVLINSSLGSEPIYWRLRPRSWLIALAALLAPMPLRERWIFNVGSNIKDTQHQKTHLQLWLDIQQQRPIGIKNLVTMLRAAAHFSPINSCAVKGLVITSKGDRLVAHQCSQAIATQFNWPLNCHPSAGHDLPMDAPEWLCQQICCWIKLHR